ncbi:MAG: acyltransferase [Cellulomonadaceae bacterium]|jgi:peptidoglycan/LPS O-acetylase OafA/YrhL|nr:acyltransferase [Cellulomonadaceae bacterium]
MTSFLGLARATPASRRRHVDLLRAVAICAVVVGHWLLINVTRTADGMLTGHNALPQLTVLHPATWLFQVMPLFFFVGGVSSAISWTRHRAKNGKAAAWLSGRSARLFPATSVLLLVAVVGAALAGWAGAPDPLIAEVVHMVAMPLWFLVVYLLVIVATPVMYALHQRFGLAVPALLIALVAVGDVLMFTTGNRDLAFGNNIFGWFAIYQLGFAYQDESLRLTPRRAAVVLLASVAVLTLMVTAGPYPLSMVSVPGERFQNAAPLSAALIVLGFAQIAVAALIAQPADRWLARNLRAWAAVIAVNAVIFTVFLWHMAAAFLAALVLDGLGWLPAAPVASAGWWVGRLPWMLACAVVLALVVVVAGQARRAEWAVTRLRPASGIGVPAVTASLPVVVAAYIAGGYGMFLIASAGLGPHGPLILPTSGLILILAAALALRLGRYATASDGGPDPVFPVRGVSAGRG